MKLPWNKQYLQISFHVIITVILIYIIGLCIANIQTVFQMTARFTSVTMLLVRPLLVAFVFSYLADPLVRRFQKLAPPRWQSKEDLPKRTFGTACVYLLLLAILTGTTWYGVQKIGSADAASVTASINSYIQGFSDLFVLLNVKLTEAGVLQYIDGFLHQLVQNITLFAKNFILNLAETAGQAGGWIMNLVLGLTAAFYLLMEKEKILSVCNELLDLFLPAKWSRTVKHGCAEINTVFSGYIVGQITDAAAMGVMITVAFTIAGIRYPVMIGIISGIANLIPYVGAVVAFLLSVSVGLLSGSPIKALYAAIIVLVVQQIDGFFLVPRIVGKSVQLHPVFVLLSLSIFGSLFGIWGMILAVPCTAIIKLFFVQLYHKKKGM